MPFDWFPQGVVLVGLGFEGVGTEFILEGIDLGPADRCHRYLIMGTQSATPSAGSTSQLAALRYLGPGFLEYW
jgi:hypothetical protein